MTYEPQGVFAEGRTFDFEQEEGIFTPQYAKSKRGPKPKGSRFSKCEGCGNSFTVTRGAVGKYCSKPCMHQSRIESRPVGFDCSRCLASVGIGMNVASRLLGVTKGIIQRSWRKEGIRAQLPKGVDSWMQYRVRAESSVCGWWGNAETAAMWMSEYNPRFPDWSSIWNRKKANLRYSIKRKTNHGFRVVTNLRTKLRFVLNRERVRKSEKTITMIGCTYNQLKVHLESGFKRGMRWDNYGTLWHVDHVIPCAAFDHTDPKQRAQCWHWTNLRALDAKKNLQKSDKITEPQMSLMLCVSH